MYWFVTLQRIYHYVCSFSVHSGPSCSSFAPSVNNDGKLSVTCIYVMHVTLWTQQECREEGDDTPVPWLRTVIRITPDPNYLPQTQSATYRQWFCLNNGSLLVLNLAYGSYSILILYLKKN
jgi:hypothetical protein